MDVCSASLLLPKDGSPNRRSREAPLVPGGGAKVVLATSRDVRCCMLGGGGALVAEMLAICCASKDILGGLWLRGGEYGGGGRGDAMLTG
jgi:hypothetical protein